MSHSPIVFTRFQYPAIGLVLVTANGQRAIVELSNN